MTNWVYTFGDGKAEGAPAILSGSAVRALILRKCAISACRFRQA